MSKLLKSQKVSVEQFADIYDLVDTLRERKTVRKSFANHYKSNKLESMVSHASFDHKENFYGTKTYEESMNLLENGWHEGVTMIENAGLNPHGGKGIRFKTDVVGGAPCIPNAIMGLPDSMFATEDRHQKMREVTIAYGIGGHADITARELAQAGRILLDAVASIEKSGINVRIVLCKITASRGEPTNPRSQNVGIAVPIKKADDKLNLKKVAYPLSHPSFFRRQYFHWLETQQSFGYNEKDHGYSVTKYADYRGMLESVGVLKPSDLFVGFYDLYSMYGSEDVISFFARQNAIFAKKS